MNDQYVIKGCKLYWACLHEVSRFSEKFEVKATNISKSDEKALKALGLKVQDGKEKGKPEMGMYLTAKATRAVPVVDAKRNTIADTSNIGNGTIANVAVSAFNYDHPTGGKGVGCGLQAVQIVELVEYSKGAVFEEEEGYTVETPAEDKVPF